MKKTMILFVTLAVITVGASLFTTMTTFSNSMMDGNQGRVVRTSMMNNRNRSMMRGYDFEDLPYCHPFLIENQNEKSN